MLKNKTITAHPFLFALYPILFFYDLNKHELWFSETIIPIIISLSITLILLALFRLIFKNFAKSGIIVSSLLILIFFYDAILTGISNNGLGKFILAKDPNLLWSYGIFLFILFGALKAKKGSFHGANQLFNIISLILLIFPLFSVGLYEIKKTIFSSEKTSAHQKVSFQFHKDISKKPDIYYIILDAYAREDILKNFYNFDNSEFLDFLKRKGFYVAPRSRTNYPVTVPSVSSTLNMNYIDKLVPEKDRFEKNLLPMDNLVENNQVVMFLKSIGYKYIHFASGFEQTNKSKHADITETYSKLLTPFGEYLINKTFLKAFNLKFLDPDHRRRNTILHAFDKLEEVPDIEQPTFAFAHILMPHGPYVFDENGAIPDISDDRNISAYLDFLSFANKKTIDLIDKILSQSNDPPIIIIQSDHGEELLSQCIQPEEVLLKEKMDILNAFYLPGNAKELLYESITPVNSFRLILDHYFGANLGFIEDKTYFTYCYAHIYQPVLVPDESFLPEKYAGSRMNKEWIKSLIKATETYANYGAAYNSIGAEYLKGGNYEEAEKYFMKAIEGDLNETSHLTYLHLGFIYATFKRFEESVEVLKKAIKVAPNVERAHSILGFSYLSLKQYNEAVTSLKTALRINPDNTENILDLGVAYSNINHHEDALEQYRKVVRIEPDNLKAINNIIKELLKSGDIEEAVEPLRHLIQLKPDSLKARFNLGNVYKNLSKNKEALEQYREVIRIEPSHHAAIRNLITTLLQLGKYEETIKPLKYFLQIKPNSFSTHGILGNVYSNLNRNKEAVEQFKKALEINPADARTHYFLAEIYDRLSDGQNALKHTSIAKQFYEANDKVNMAKKANIFSQKLSEKYGIKQETLHN